jgi:hypothetical protein
MRRPGKAKGDLARVSAMSAICYSPDGNRYRVRGYSQARSFCGIEGHRLYRQPPQLCPSNPRVCGTRQMSGQQPFTVAIMQPYFLPYAGYFRLFAASDLFVIYDCVQFPRRGWVHRNRLTDARGHERWLTLPLEKAPRNALIRDLRFPANAADLLVDRLRPFHLVSEDRDVRLILEAMRDVRENPLDYLERLLEQVVGYLRLPWQVTRSSALDVPATVRGQDRVIEIARRLGAARYVNAPGGRSLYDPQAFADAGIDLRFLQPHRGPSSSILARIMREPRDVLANDIKAAARYIAAERSEPDPTC